MVAGPGRRRIALWLTGRVEFPLLASLPEAARQGLLDHARRRRFARREMVFHEGDPADSLHLVRSGRLGVQVSTPDGQVAMLRVLTPGQHFGDMALVGAGRRRSATVVALEPAETLSISSTTFHALRAQHPEVREVVLTALVLRVDDLSQRLLEAQYDGLDRRVARHLALLCEAYADPAEPDGPVEVPLTQEQLAAFVGGTRPSVNAVLRRLEDRRIIELSRGRLVVRDRAALVARLA